MAEGALPRIPDEAFNTVAQRHGDMIDVSTPAGETPETAMEASTNFCRSLGLDNENDPRAYWLLRTVMAEFRGVVPDALPSGEVHAGVLGLQLGLMLAQATSWEPPMPRSSA
jgi:hypothetical protein